MTELTTRERSLQNRKRRLSLHRPTPMLTDDTLSEFEGLLARATAGPLFVADGGICSRVCPEDGSNVICCEPERVMQASLAKWPANAALIVALVNAAPSLIADLRRMREALAPFAAEADQHDRLDIRDHDGFGGDVSFGDLRRARTALTGEPRA